MKLPVSRVEQIERETPEIHGELSIFAAALLDSVTAPPVQALALPRAVEAGLVIEREGVWSSPTRNCEASTSFALSLI